MRDVPTEGTAFLGWRGASPALTVTALTNCSLQLLLPTTSARLVFLISLSTVLCRDEHGRTNVSRGTPLQALKPVNTRRGRRLCGEAKGAIKHFTPPIVALNEVSEQMQD